MVLATTGGGHHTERVWRKGIKQAAGDPVRVSEGRGVPNLVEHVSAPVTVKV